jgi:hypothetical protein
LLAKQDAAGYPFRQKAHLAAVRNIGDVRNAGSQVMYARRTTDGFPRPIRILRGRSYLFSQYIHMFDTSLRFTSCAEADRPRHSCEPGVLHELDEHRIVYTRSEDSNIYCGGRLYRVELHCLGI